MATEETVVLATRIPKSLHQQSKVYCIENGMALREFVAAAVKDKLKREQGERAARRKPER